MSAIDRETKKWIRNAADEKAAKAGMRFDPERGLFVCDWMEGYCCLYQGSNAGQPMILLDYERDFFMRLHGWVRWSDEWNEWIRRFTHAGFWAAKKNGKSPMAAAHNLYMLSGDGEPGQNVYQMAHDGQQAKIAQGHAVNMVRQSPSLRSDCKINKTTLLVTHEPSNSVLQIVTGDDKRGADAKHGYNGSVTIDEMHVVTRPMMEAVGRAGISRKEPLQVSFSTAGTDPSSAGYERCQYGRQVNSGDRDDPNFLHVEYSAPADLTAAQIDEHLEEYGKAANPAWGDLVKPSEFVADWKRSKSEPRKVAIFMQERLNVWIGSTSPWLDKSGWEKGRRRYTLAELSGRPCYIGMDLSLTRDMTACPLVFPWPEDGPDVLRLWPMFWLPDRRAEELDHLYPFRSWHADGHLNLTAGNVTDFVAIEAKLLATIKEHNLQVCGLYFDQWNAEQFTQRLEESLGCERVAVRQGYQTLSPLSKEFERRVIAGLVQHPANRVLDWQVGHVRVKHDENQNIRPAKPEEGTGKTIDGVAATVNAMAGIISGDGDSQPSLLFI